MLLSPMIEVLAKAHSNSCDISANIFLWKRLKTQLETVDAGNETRSAYDIR